MKYKVLKILFGLQIIILCSLWIKANDNFVLVTHNNPVYIYPSAFSTIPKRVIQQIDSINYIYSFKVLEDSIFRFKVQIYEPDCESELCSDIGWIDKINTTVYLGIHEYEDKKACLRLYEQPNINAKAIDISENYHHTMIGYVDHIYNDWYHVIVFYQGVMFKGWTYIYSSNPY